MADRITRKFLEALGVPDTAKDAIIDAYRDAIDPVIEENKALKKQIEGIDFSKDWKAEAEQASSALEALKKDVANQDAKRAKEAAYRSILTEAGIADKRIDVVMRASGAVIDGLELDKDGKPVKHDDLVSAAKTDWADLIPTQVTVGASVPHPPAPAGKAPSMTKEAIMAIKDAGERRQAIKDNHELFGI